MVRRRKATSGADKAHRVECRASAASSHPPISVTHSVETIYNQYLTKHSRRPLPLFGITTPALVSLPTQIRANNTHLHRQRLLDLLFDSHTFHKRICDDGLGKYSDASQRDWKRTERSGARRQIKQKVQSVSRSVFRRNETAAGANVGFGWDGDGVSDVMGVGSVMMASDTPADDSWNGGAVCERQIRWLIQLKHEPSAARRSVRHSRLTPHTSRNWARSQHFQPARTTTITRN